MVPVEKKEGQPEEAMTMSKLITKEVLQNSGTAAPKCPTHKTHQSGSQKK